MKDLITYLVSEITGSSDFSVSEELIEDKIQITILAKPEIVGLIIGKEGKTVKNLRKIASIRAARDNKIINISVTEG